MIAVGQTEGVKPLLPPLLILVDLDRQQCRALSIREPVVRSKKQEKCLEHHLSFAFWGLFNFAEKD